MTFSELTQTLDQHKTDLSELGVLSLHVFGSVARDQAGPNSDVDFLVEFNRQPSFDRYMQLKIFLEDLLGVRVDLVTQPALRRELRPSVERDARRVA
jgi:uncharacterized protein